MDPISVRRNPFNVDAGRGSSMQQTRSIKDPVMSTDQRQASETKLNSYRTGPDERGHFGLFGGRFVAETFDAAHPRS